MNHTHLARLIVIAGLTILAQPSNAQQPASKPPLGAPQDATLFNGNWYRVYTEKVGWDMARDKCRRLGGQLAVVPDEATWTFLKSLSRGLQLWLGGTDEGSGIWRWVDGSPFTFKAWHKGEPNNRKNDEHYIEMYRDGWNDLRKDGTYKDPRYQVVGFICEWKKK
jgi:hypothetical protein